MSEDRERITLAGSGCRPPLGAREVGAPGREERFEVSVLLRSRAENGYTEPAPEETGGRAPSGRRHLSRRELADARGASPEDLGLLGDFAREYGLEIVEQSPAERRVVLSGTAEAFERAFEVRFALYEHRGTTFRGYAGEVSVPARLGEVVRGVFGLDERPIARPHFRARRVSPYAGGLSYTPVQLAKTYDFPAGATGEGQALALIELGGGYRSEDLTEYFSGLGVPAPAVSSISVDGAHNAPTGDPSGPDGEVALDIEVAGAAAPAASILVYFTPNTERGFVDALKRAVHDEVNQPSVVSISWGAPENEWSEQAVRAFEEVFQDAARLGVTVLAAAGDRGSSDGETDGLQHVDFPASSPYVLGCGGTRLELSAQGAIASEVVWNEPTGGATGGGVSEAFGLPSWQQDAGVPPSANPGGRVGRGVPDVAADADPATGYEVLVDGTRLVVGGTSAVAPLWAALISCINQELGNPVGYLNPLLYRLASGGSSAAPFHDITSGDNGAYAAGPGWDACTGLGSPDGSTLLDALRGA